VVLEAWDRKHSEVMEVYRIVLVFILEPLNSGGTGFYLSLAYDVI